MPSCLPHWSDWENDASCCLSGHWGRCCLRSRKQSLPRETQMTKPYLKRTKKVKDKAVHFVFAFSEWTVWRQLSRYKERRKSGKNKRFALNRWVKPDMKLLILWHILKRITERQGGLPTRNWRLVPLEIEAKNCARDKCSHNSSSGTTCIRARVASPELSNLSKPSFRANDDLETWLLDSCWWWCPNKRCCCCCWSWFWGKRWHSLVTADNWATAWLRYFHCLLRA